MKTTLEGHEALLSVDYNLINGDVNVMAVYVLEEYRGLTIPYLAPHIMKIKYAEIILGCQDAGI